MTILHHLTYFTWIWLCFPTLRSIYSYCLRLFYLCDTAVPKHTFVCIQNRRALHICQIDVCMSTAPNLPSNKQYHDHCSFVSECTMWCISIVSPRTKQIISSNPPKIKKKQNLLFICFYRSSPGETVQRLTQIYFNTQHNIWTKRTKRQRVFYILLSRRKKMK